MNAWSPSTGMSPSQFGESGPGGVTLDVPAAAFASPRNVSATIAPPTRGTGRGADPGRGRGERPGPADQGGDQLAVASDTVRSPDGMVKVSPAETAFAVIVPEKPKLFVDAAEHTEKWV